MATTMATMLVVLIALFMLILLLLITLMIDSIRNHCSSDHTANGSKGTTTKLVTEKSAACSTD